MKYRIGFEIMDMNMTDNLSYPLLVGEGSDLFLMKVRKCLLLAILNQCLLWSRLRYHFHTRCSMSDLYRLKCVFLVYIMISLRLWFKSITLMSELYRPELNKDNTHISDWFFVHAKKLFKIMIMD